MGTFVSLHGRAFGFDAETGALIRNGTPNEAVGSSSARLALGATAVSHIQRFVETSATTGDTRLQNLRLYFSGAGGSGEVIRAYGIVNNVQAAVGGTVNGIHATLAVNGASGSISGAANAIRATLEVGTGATPGGTLSALQVDSNVASGVTLPASHAFIRFTNSGAVSLTRLLEVPTVASGGILAAHITDAVTHSIRIRDAAGTLYYLMATTTVTNRTGGG